MYFKLVIGDQQFICQFSFVLIWQFPSAYIAYMYNVCIVHNTADNSWLIGHHHYICIYIYQWQRVLELYGTSGPWMRANYPYGLCERFTHQASTPPRRNLFVFVVCFRRWAGLSRIISCWRVSHVAPIKQHTGSAFKVPGAGSVMGNKTSRPFNRRAGHCLGTLLYVFRNI